MTKLKLTLVPPGPIIPSGPQPKPDFKAWDGIDQIRLGQAAALWAEIEPTIPGAVNHADVYPIFQRLKEEMEAGNLPKPPKGVKPLRHMVTRGDLKKIAEKWSQRSKFLYPEERQSRQGRVKGEPRPETIEGWKEAHDMIERGLKTLGTTIIKKAAAWAAQDSDKSPAALERNRRRYLAHQKKRQNGNKTKN